MEHVLDWLAHNPLRRCRSPAQRPLSGAPPGRRVAQLTRRLLELRVLGCARLHERAECFGDDVELLPRGLLAASGGVLQRASSSSVTTLVSVWIATCHAFRSAHSVTLTSQSTTAATQTKKNGGRLTRR
jgi:hypothetical protein